MNPRLNAIVNLADDATLLQQADARDRDLARGQRCGWLHGVPRATKGTAHAVGFPTTIGCTLLRDALPAQDSV